MLDNLKLEFVPDFDSVQASFDLIDGALEKLRTAVGKQFGTCRYASFDYEEGIWLSAEVKIGHQWFWLHANTETGRVRLSKYADQRGLDYTLPLGFDFETFWPEFIAPLRAIVEVLN